MKPDRFVRVETEDGEITVNQCGDCGMLEPDIDPLHRFVPQRIQLSRKKGWRMPPHSVKVDRSTRWGNPYAVGMMSLGTRVKDREDAVRRFRQHLQVIKFWSVPLRSATVCTDVLTVRRELRGKNLACWCPLPKPGEPDLCHAAVLLLAANGGDHSITESKP